MEAVTLRGHSDLKSAEPPATRSGPKGQERSDTVAIPLTSEFVAAPANLSDDDQMLIVELRESDPELVALVREAEDSEVAAGGGRKGKRAEYYCAGCGYGIVVYGQPPSCPMCREPRWEHVEWRPFSQLLDFPLTDLARSVGPRVPRLGRARDQRGRRVLALRVCDGGQVGGPDG